MVFRTLLKSVFEMFNRCFWLGVWVFPASPSLRVGVLKSPKCPVIRTKMSGIFPQNFIKSPTFTIIFELQPSAKADILCNLSVRIYIQLERTPQIVPFRFLIILHNSTIFTPKSEVGFCVGWSERKQTKRRSNTEYSECNFAKQNKMSDYGVWSNNPIQFSGKSLPWLYFINILSK